VSLKKYYNRLGLTETANSEEVRRQFRKLAMKYHPDRNPSKDAQEEFLKITEAYEILSGKQKQKIAPINNQSTANRPNREERMRAARMRYYEQLKREEREAEEYYQRLISGKGWKTIKFSAVLGIILSMCLIVDFILPNHLESDRIAEYAKDIYSSWNTSDILVSLVNTERKEDYWIEGLNYPFYGKNPEFIVQKSWIFHDAKNLFSFQGGAWIKYPVHYTFLSFSFVLIPIFLLPLITLVYKRQSIVFAILYYLSIYLGFGLMLLFLLCDLHWLHFITLGFL
jgi:curved DNA-binding protein CbpA